MADKIAILNIHANLFKHFFDVVINMVGVGPSIPALLNLEKEHTRACKQCGT